MGISNPIDKVTAAENIWYLDLDASIVTCHLSGGRECDDGDEEHGITRPPCPNMSLIRSSLDEFHVAFWVRGPDTKTIFHLFTIDEVSNADDLYVQLTKVLTDVDAAYDGFSDVSVTHQESVEYAAAVERAFEVVLPAPENIDKATAF